MPPYSTFLGAIESAIQCNRAVHKTRRPLDIDQPHYVMESGTVILSCAQRVGKTTWARSMLEQKPCTTLLISTYDIPDMPRAYRVTRGQRSFTEAPYIAVAQDEHAMYKALSSLRHLTQRSRNIDMVIIDCWLPEFSDMSASIMVDNKPKKCTMLEYAAQCVQEAYGHHALLVVLG